MKNWRSLNHQLPKIFFLLYLFTLLWSANVPEIIQHRPRSVHQWRQADCASLSLNYYQNDISFWTPQLHHQAGDNGYAAAEFPLLYYIVSRLYTLFGFHEFLHRGLVLMIAMISWWVLFRMSNRLIGNEWLALVPVVILSTTPVYFFYANNFMPNVPAISLAIIGLYAFFRYLESEEKRLGWLYLMGVLMLLTCLTKASEGISLIAIAAVAVLGLFPWKGFPKVQLPRYHWLHFSAIVLSVIGFTAGWYSYARHYNTIYGNKQSLIGIFPIWEMSEADWELTEYMVDKVWWTHFHSPIVLYALGGMGILFFVLWNKLNHNLRWLTLLTLLGCIAYALLFFKAFAMHDYYFLTLVIYPIFLLISLLELLWRTIKNTRWYYQAIIALPLIVLCSFGFYQNQHIQWTRYNKKDFMSGLPQGSYELEPYLRSIGLERTDKVVSLKDRSPNVTLYLMNNPGYTQAFINGEVNIGDMRSWGAKYLVLNDSSYLQIENYQPYLQKQIGAYKGVLIYDLTEE
jgi:hypothetical protein